MKRLTINHLLDHCDERVRVYCELDSERRVTWGPNSAKYTATIIHVTRRADTTLGRDVRKFRGIGLSYCGKMFDVMHMCRVEQLDLVR